MVHKNHPEARIHPDPFATTNFTAHSSITGRTDNTRNAPRVSSGTTGVASRRGAWPRQSRAARMPTPKPRCARALCAAEPPSRASAELCERLVGDADAQAAEALALALDLDDLDPADLAGGRDV